MACPVCQNASPLKILGPYLAGRALLFQKRSLASCLTCDLVYVDPIPSQKELSEYYRTYWSREEDSLNKTTRTYYLAQSLCRLEFMTENCPHLKNVLDIGAGSGELYTALHQKGFRGNYDAIEPDEDQKKILSGLGAGTVFRRLEDIAPIVPPPQYDLIVLSHVLEHIPNPNLFLGSILPLLMPGGRLFVEVPNQDHTYKTIFEPHLLFFSVKHLDGILKRHGTVLRIQGCGRPKEILRAELSKEAQKSRHSWRKWVPSPFKTILKKMIRGTPPTPSIDETKKRFCLDVYTNGDERQWIRAILLKS